MKNPAWIYLFFLCGCANFTYTPPTGPIFQSDTDASLNRDTRWNEYKNLGPAISILPSTATPTEDTKKIIKKMQSYFASLGYQTQGSTADMKIEVYTEANPTTLPTLFATKTNARVKIAIKVLNSRNETLDKHYKGHYKREFRSEEQVIEKAFDEAINLLLIDDELYDFLER